MEMDLLNLKNLILLWKNSFNNNENYILYMGDTFIEALIINYI